MTNGYYTYYGEKSVMYRTIESLGCTPEVNITLHVIYTSIIKKNFLSKSFLGVFNNTFHLLLSLQHPNILG